MNYTIKRGHEGYQLHDANGLVADGMSAQGARTVMTACNAHDELVASLKDVLRIAMAASQGVTGNQPRIHRAIDALKKAAGGAT